MCISPDYDYSPISVYLIVNIYIQRLAKTPKTKHLIHTTF